MNDILDSDDQNENEDDTEHHSYKNREQIKAKSNNNNNNNNNDDDDTGSGGKGDEAIKLLLKHLASIGSHNNKLDLMLTEMLAQSQSTHKELRENVKKFLKHDLDSQKGMSL